MRTTLLALLLLGGSVVTGCNSPDLTAAPGVEDNSLLPAPKPGEGYQLEMGPFSVPRGSEVQICRTFKLPNDEPMAFNRFKEIHNTGSHHVILFRRIATNKPENQVDDQVFPCWGVINFDEWEFVIDSQQKNDSDNNLPDGVGMVFEPHHQMMIQAHFLNAAADISKVTTPLDGHSWINMYKMPMENVRSRAAGKFTVNARVFLPARTSNLTFTRDCLFSNPASVFAMTGHFHERGKEFRVDALDADYNPTEMMYRGTDWNDQPLTHFQTPMPFLGDLSGGPPGIRFSCTYDNDTDKDIVWGGNASTQEHCNLFFWYFDPTIPSTQNPDLTCLSGSGGW